MRRAADALRSFPIPLALLLAVAAVVAASWNISTAPLQGPDEPEHAAYVQHLAETGKLPKPSGSGDPLAPDVEQARAILGLSALVQNSAARPDWSQARRNALHQFEENLPQGARGNGGSGLSTGKNPPLYYAAGAAAWKLTPGGSILGHLFVLRIVSGVFLLVAVAAAWLLAGEIFQRALPRMLCASVVALLPIVGFMAGVAGPETASLAAWTIFLWLALRMVRTGPSASAAALTALAATAAVLVHGRNLAIVPVLAITLVVAWVANRSRPRQIAAGIAASGAVTLAGAAVFRLVTASSGGSVYGGETNLGNTAAFNIRQLASSIWQFYLPRLASMQPRLGPPIGFRQVFIEQFLGGTFASNEVYMPYWVYDLAQVCLVLLLVAFYTVVVLRWRGIIERWPAAVIVGSAALCLLLFLHVASYRALVNGGDNPLITGRYLLPLAAPLGLIVATVSSSLPKRAGATFAGMVVGGLFCLELSAIFLSLERFYA